MDNITVRFIHTAKRNEAAAKELIKEGAETESQADDKEIIFGSYAPGGDNVRLFLVDVGQAIQEVDVEQVQIDYSVEKVGN